MTDPSGFTATGFNNQSVGDFYRLYATPIVSSPIAGFDNIPGILIAVSKWVPEYWKDQETGAEYVTLVLETTFVFIANPPSAGAGMVSGGGSYLDQSWNQIWQGNYGDDVTALGTAGQVALGFTPIDWVADGRDIVHDVQNWKWSWGHAGKTALDGFGLIPYIGFLKYFDEAGTLLKRADDIPVPKSGQSFFQNTKYTDKVLKQMKGGTGEFHSFPESIRAFEGAGSIKPLKGGDGILREMLEIPGSYPTSSGAWKDGVFQFMKEADGAINHRLFVPTTTP